MLQVPLGETICCGQMHGVFFSKVSIRRAHALAFADPRRAIVHGRFPGGSRRDGYVGASLVKVGGCKRGRTKESDERECDERECDERESDKRK